MADTPRALIEGQGLRHPDRVLHGGPRRVCPLHVRRRHERDIFCRVVEDCVAGSGLDAHEAALNAMEYLQTGARRPAAEVTGAFEWTTA